MTQQNNNDKLKTHLHSLSMADALQAYPSLDKNLTDFKAIRKLVTVDLFYLMSRVLKIPNINRQWLYERCREVQARPDGRLFLWAREHYKSTIITFGKTLQDILSNPELTVCILSAKHENSQSFLGQIRRALESNVIIKKAFPDVCWSEPLKEAEVWNKSEIVLKRQGNPKEMTVTAASLDSLRVGGHYDILIYDDVITQKEVTSPEMVQQITTNFRLSLSLSKEGGAKRYIGTRYARKDTYSVILKDGIAEACIYPATDDGTAFGRPVLFSADYWEQKIRENTTFDLSCQYLQNPQEEGTKTFDINNLCYWDVRPTAMRLYLLCDPGVKTTKESCDTAMVVMGVTGNRQLFILDGYSHKMTLTERWERYSGLYKKWASQVGPGGIHCAYETYGHGATDLEHFQDKMRTFPNSVNFKIQELTGTIKGHQHKAARIERLEPDIRASKLWLPWDNTQQTENPGMPTTDQQEAQQSGRGFLNSKPILVKLKDGTKYNLVEILVEQLDEFPFGGRVDLLDVVSRIYDCDIRVPENLKSRYGSVYVKQKGAAKKPMTVGEALFPQYRNQVGKAPSIIATGRVRSSGRYSRK